MSQYLGFRPAYNSSKYYFISYSSDDVSLIEPIVRPLCHTIPLWYDFGLTYGNEWKKEIADHIEKAEAVLLFLSKQVLAKGSSSYVYIEYQMAKDFFNKPIFVIQMEEIKRSDIPNELAGWWIELNQYQKIIKKEGTTNEKILEMICNALNINIFNNYCLRDSENNIFKLRKGVNGIGNNEQKNTMHILNSGVSDRHAIIEIEEDRLPVIFDWATTSGTYVNGKRIDPKMKTVLNPGDEICFGESKYVFDVYKEE